MSRKTLISKIKEALRSQGYESALRTIVREAALEQEGVDFDEIDPKTGDEIGKGGDAKGDGTGAATTGELV